MCLPIKPFKVEAEFEHAGLKCAVTQNREGQHRCGYVRVPPSHPAYGKDDDAGIEVHGGITFSGQEPCAHEDGQGWWLGFDCAHAFDAHFDPNASIDDMTTEEGKSIIRLRDEMRSISDLDKMEHFWTHEEVMAETMGLAEQLAALGSAGSAMGMNGSST